MLSRPVDSSGDILPVLALGDLSSGPAAVGPALRNHLTLFPGDWWEYPEKGNPIFDLISISRRTQQDADALCSALTAYVLSFPCVQSISNAQASFEDHIFSFSCTAHTESGDAVTVYFSE